MRNTCVAIFHIFTFRLSSTIEASFVMPVEANIADARNTMVISNVDIAMFQWYSVFSILANQHKANSNTYTTERGKRLHGFARIRTFQNFVDENIRVIISYLIRFTLIQLLPCDMRNAPCQGCSTISPRSFIRFSTRILVIII